METVKADCVESFRLAGKTPGFIAFLLLQRCLYDYAHLNLANDNFLDVIEERLYARPRRGAGVGHGGGGANILTLKKLAASLHIVLMLLATKRSPFISNDARASFQEMLQNAQAVRAAVDSSRDLLDGIVGAVQASASNRTSEMARVLTVLSGILLPLTLITGIYGMNFENMPELKTPHGYFVALGVLVVIGLGLFLLFHRLGWTKPSVSTAREARRRAGTAHRLGRAGIKCPDFHRLHPGSMTICSRGSAPAGVVDCLGRALPRRHPHLACPCPRAHALSVATSTRSWNELSPDHSTGRAASCLKFHLRSLRPGTSR